MRRIALLGVSFVLICLIALAYAGTIDINPLKGTGTTNRLARWTNATTLGNGVMSDDGTNVTLLSGQLITPVGSVTAPAINLGSAILGFYASTSTILDLTVAGTQAFRFSTNGLFFTTAAGRFALSSAGAMSWSSGTAGAAGEDVFLYRDAAGILTLRNAANAQTLRVYGTWTNASNLVNGELAATSTLVTLAARTLGTGADDVSINLDPAGAGVLQIDGTDGVSGTCSSVVVTKGLVTGCTP